ncbi:MAG: hypothetical protein OER87_15740 [Gammaproteobacteria bacterium]|nr:hypothetical protein [Gammaproteobacteria bacterium]
MVALVAGSALLLAVCGLVLVLFVYARQFLMPAINRARDREIAGNTGAAVTFKRLHLQSLLINVLQLLLLVAVTVYLLWV